jgi:hypothetical protein
MRAALCCRLYKSLFLLTVGDACFAVSYCYNYAFCCALLIAHHIKKIPSQIAHN